MVKSGIGHSVAPTALVRGLLLMALGGCTLSGARGGDLAAQPLLAGYDWTRPAEHCALPGELDEASGLEHDGHGNLVALHDNASTLFRVSCAGTIALDGRRLDGDFEGVTRHAGHWYLLTSPGGVYEVVLRADGQAVAEGPRPVPGVGNGLAGRCGFEGIAVVAPATLMVACKYPREPRPGFVQLYQVGLEDGLVTPLAVDVNAVLSATGLTRLRPSGLAWLPKHARLLVLAGKEHVLLEVAGSGELVAWRRLPRRWHRQAEGIAVLPDGRVAIVDEADGRRATLGVYAPVATSGGQMSSSRAGRTSMLPTFAGGMPDAIRMASSRSLASIR